MPKFYIATAIPYVNARPHIGFALECVQADVIARFKKMNGYDVYFATGTDENSLKNVQAAEKLGIKTEELCEQNAIIFKELADKINLSYSCFIRTGVDPNHRKVAETLWGLSNKNGDIYKKKYRGLYCVGCELFYTENELIDGYCPEHHTPKPEMVEEENYFFRLSKYQDKLLEVLQSDEMKIIPESRKSEITNFLKSGLEDFSISRSVKRARGWGIPVPDDKSQIMYVWYDALSYYLTAAGMGSDKTKFEKLWPIDMHVIGKGIVRFHAIYWPAMLMSGGLDLPKSIFIHGYITVEGQKMSKSLGNVIDPIAMIDRHGADLIRFYLMKEISTFQDGDFSDKTFKDSINNELVGNLGNFVNRTLTFISSKFEGKIDEQKLGEKDREFLDQVNGLVGEINGLLESYQLNIALLKILEVSNLSNRYFQNNEPWKLAKEDPVAAKRILFVCANVCRTLGMLIYPYMPSASENLLGYLKEKPSSLKSTKNLVKHFDVSAPKILFGKVE